MPPASSSIVAMEAWVTRCWSIVDVAMVDHVDTVKLGDDAGGYPLAKFGDDSSPLTAT
jgi:hypothetical protein